jgi:hypothetical protein
MSGPVGHFSKEQQMATDNSKGSIIERNCFKNDDSKQRGWKQKKLKECYFFSDVFHVMKYKKLKIGINFYIILKLDYLAKFMRVTHRLTNKVKLLLVSI